MNLRSALLSVSSLTMLSRIAGFIRDWLIATTFGSSAGADAFFVAFRFPNLLRRLFAEGAFSQAFVPILVAQKNLGIKSFRDFINKTTTVLIFVIGVVTILGVIFAPELVLLTAPGFTKTPERFALTVSLTRICFPYILFVSLLALISAVLQANKKFSLPALAPLFLNLSFIAGIIFTLDFWQNPIYVLAYAAIIGGLIQLSIPLIGIYKIGLMPKPKFKWKSPPVIEMLKNIFPAMLGVASGQLNLLFNTIFASFLITGSVSWLYYADRIMELPVGLLGAALAVILLPSLTQSILDKKQENVNRLVDWGLRIAIIISLPCAVAFVICGPAIFVTLFNFGSFTVDDALKSGDVLIFYAIGLFPLIGQKVLNPVFFAHKDLKTPAKLGFIALIINQAQNFIWVPIFAHAGLALSISITAVIQFSLQLIILWRRNKIYLKKDLLLFICKQIVVLILLILLLLYLTPEWQWWLSVEKFARIFTLVKIIIFSVIIYSVSWYILGIRAKDFSINT